MERKAIWDYYRLEFLPNGYPGRRTDGELMAHPIYGPHVITDYLLQYERTRDSLFLESACKVADAAVRSMVPFQNGLVFMYDEEKAKVSSKKGTWYSGLTQARYVDVFTKLLAKEGTEQFREPLAAVLASLTIPVEKGGVARYTSNGGLIIEEYPALFPNCTLNGWTTATCVVKDLARATNDDNVWDVFNKSVRALEELIAIYDVGEVANSRYKLEGEDRFRVTSRGTAVGLEDCRVVVPAAGTFESKVSGDPAGEILAAGPVTIPDGGSKIIRVRMSRYSWPSPNRVHLRVNAPARPTRYVDWGCRIQSVW